MMSVAVIALALLLDRVFSEPARYHPLVGIGRLAMALESALNRSQDNALRQTAKGTVAVLVLSAPFVFVAWLLENSLQSLPWPAFMMASVMVFFCIGWQSLKLHALAVARPLQRNAIVSARQATAMMVSRDTDGLDERAVAAAATESVLENGADAVFAPLFWFLLAGLPGVVFYRICNTLDAMWGYRNSRFEYFGKPAARLDDLLNTVPARLTALLYALAGDTRCALSCWRMQGRYWKSRNAGVVMAAGAGALNAELGGEAFYHGNAEARPRLGPEAGQVDSFTMLRACHLLDRALLVFLLLAGVSALVVTL